MSLRWGRALRRRWRSDPPDLVALEAKLDQSRRLVAHLRKTNMKLERQNRRLERELDLMASRRFHDTWVEIQDLPLTNRPPGDEQAST